MGIIRAETLARRLGRLGVRVAALARDSRRRLCAAPLASMLAVLCFIAALSTCGVTIASWQAVHRAVGVRDAQSLVLIGARDRTGRPTQIALSRYLDIARSEVLATPSPYAAGVSRLSVHGTSVEATVDAVSPEYFDLVESTMLLGRRLARSDELSDVVSAVVSHRLWVRVFGATPDVVGTRFLIGGRGATVVGVLTPSSPSLQVDSATDVFVLASVYRRDALSGVARTPFVVGRLLGGRSLEQTAGMLDSVWSRMSATEGDDVRLAPLESLEGGFSTLRRQYAQHVAILVLLAFVVVASALVTVSSLLSSTVQQSLDSIRTRLALGASASDIHFGPVLDCASLAFCAVPLAVAAATGACTVLDSLVSTGLATPLDHPIEANSTVVAALLSASAPIALMASAGPCALLRKLTCSNQLFALSATTTAWPKRVLLAVHVAVSLVLLALAAVSAQAAAAAATNGAYLSSQPTAFGRLAPEPGSAPVDSQDVRYWLRLVQQLEHVSGVTSAAMSETFPALLAFAGPTQSTPISTLPRLEGTTRVAAMERVSPGFFLTYGLRVIDGRDFRWTDDSNGPRVAILSASLAFSLFGRSNAVGRVVYFPSGDREDAVEVVGVASDLQVGRLGTVATDVLYQPLTQGRRGVLSPVAHARFKAGAPDSAGPMASAVGSLGSHYLRGYLSISRWIRFASAPQSMTAGAVGVGALGSFGMVVAGAFSLVWTTIRARRRDIAIRLALGATEVTAFRVVLLDPLFGVSIGLLVGGSCLALLSRLLRSQVDVIAALSPSTTACAAFVVAAAAAVAATVPAWRASRLSLAASLRDT